MDLYRWVRQVFIAMQANVAPGRGGDGHVNLAGALKRGYAVCKKHLNLYQL